MNKKPLILVAGVIAFLILVAVAILVIEKRSEGEMLPVERYQEASSNFSGNRYQVVGRVDRQLGAREGVGRLVLVNVDHHRLPLFIPAELQGNVESGVQYRFAVLVRTTHDMTILEVQNMRKL